VAHWQLLSPDVLCIRLKLPAIEPFRWEAGQSVDLLLADGSRRAYSLAAAPGDGALLEMHIARVPGGHVSGALFDLGGPGALLQLEGPFGGFHLPRPDGAEALVLVAGGTGYAPLRAMLQTLIAQRWERPTRLYFGVRRAQDLYADAELRVLAAAHANFDYVPVCEDDLGPPDARQGRVHTVVLAEEVAMTDVDVYAAGPSPMIAALKSALTLRGLPAACFYADAFG
jgi:CDP-4-dehydro-6-deoxyglucose reductase